MVTWKNHLLRAIRLVGSQPKLAAAMGCSQSKVSWLITTAHDISAEDALKVDRATDGAVSASELRPDIWPTPHHVPHAPPAMREQARAS
jgi:DNA-binding transcriptional regulator YdaS (Cro superfamily)